MKIGNTTFTEEGLSQITKDEFLQIYKGKLDTDINEAARKLNKYFKKDVQSFKEISGKFKKTKIKGTVSDSISE